MRTIQLRTVVPKNHRVEIFLPLEIPEGPADMLVVMESSPPPAAGNEKRAAMKRTLARLRRLREKGAGRGLTLSDAVLEERREED